MYVLISRNVLVIMAVVLLNDVLCNEDEETNESLQQKARRFQEMLKHDGVKRTVQLTDKNYANLIKKKNIVVVLFLVDQGGSKDDGGSQPQAEEKNILEVAAQIFNGKIISAVCNMIDNPTSVQKAGISYAGTITIFNQGRSSIYFGQRTPDIFIPYVSKLFESPVSFINSKVEKRQYDNLDTAKSVSYITKGSSEEGVLQGVARHFQPAIKFYAVTDQKIAKSLHLKKMNSLSFSKPFERSLTMPAKVSWNEKEIASFVKENKRQIIQKLQLENIHEVWSVDTKGYVVPIFAAGTTQAGKSFLSLLKNVAKKHKDSNELHFVWIDPESFPMMGKYWQETFGVDPSLPTIGAIEMATQKAAWHELKTIDKRSEQSVNLWLGDLLKGDIVLTSINVQPSSNTEEQINVADNESPGNNKEEL